MLKQNAGAFSLNSDDLRQVSLPFEGLSIYQNRQSQPVTGASAFLVDYCNECFPGERLEVMELGSGCGIVSIMLKLYHPDWQITGLEIQAEDFELSRRNAALCGVSVDFLLHDLRTYQFRKYDLIVANPPWLPCGTGLSSPHKMRAIAREEISCSMADVLDCGMRNLHPDGSLVLIYPKSREIELRRLTQNTSLDIIDIRYTSDTMKYFITHLIRKETKI